MEEPDQMSKTEECNRSYLIDISALKIMYDLKV